MGVYCIKNEHIEFSVTCERGVSGITFIRYFRNQHIGKPNSLKVFGRKLSKRHNKDSQHHIRLHMPEGGEP